jgi:hypothetical protein
MELYQSTSFKVAANTKRAAESKRVERSVGLITSNRYNIFICNRVGEIFTTAFLNTFLI